MHILNFSIPSLLLICATVNARRSLLQRIQRNEAAEERDEYFQPRAKRDTFYIKWLSKSRECTFNGYAPNGLKEATREATGIFGIFGKMKNALLKGNRPHGHAESVIASRTTMNAKKGLAAILGGVEKKLGNATAITAPATNISLTVPTLGDALGTFCAALGMINPQPSSQDILNKVNQTIGEQTAELNKKLDQMAEGYVDLNTTKPVRALVENELETAFRLWSQCLEEPTKEKGIQCQRNAAQNLISLKPLFMPLAGNLSGNLSVDEVQKLEMYELVFRDYANLLVMELTSLIELYCMIDKDFVNATHFCELYTTRMIKEVNNFINYANNSIAAIKKRHWGQNKMGACLGTQKFYCKNFYEGWWDAHTGNICTAQCEIESSYEKKYCKVVYDIQVDGRRPGSFTKENYTELLDGQYFKASKIFGKEHLDIYSSMYQKANHEVMEKYWQNEVLSFVPEWQRAIDIAQEMKTKNATQDDAPGPKNDFSAEYPREFETTNYHFEDASDELGYESEETHLWEGNLDSPQEYFAEEDDTFDEVNTEEFDRYQSIQS